ncbi:MAG: hypothetical protein E8D44_13200 [Nitrospira sp.]|nr:MAG: hypothetical protein E8D44_13200 [Nitrospira sp.]
MSDDRQQTSDEWTEQVNKRSAMVDHAQRAYAVIADWKMNSSGGYDAEMVYLEKSIAETLTQAHAAGRREAFQEVITRQTEVIRARETLMGLVAAPTMIEQAKVRNEECSTVRDWCAKAKEEGQ